MSRDHLNLHGCERFPWFQCFNKIVKHNVRTAERIDFTSVSIISALSERVDLEPAC